MNHTTFDMNLLRVFRAVYIARNVRRAAEALGLSQPAVSHGLTRLRLQLKDQLFVRTASGVDPTSRAHHFARSVETAMAVVESALSESEHFSPATSDRRFVFHMSDLGQGEFLPMLMSHLHATAPGVRIEVVQLAIDAVLPALEQNRIDVAFGYLPDVRGTEHLRLVVDRYVVAVRAGHPQSNALGLKRTLQDLRYVVSHSHPEPETALTRLGLEGQIKLRVPHYGSVPDVLLQTDLASIIPNRPAMRFARNFDLEVSELKLVLPPVEVWAHWYWRMNHDLAHRWLREALVSLFA